MAQYSDERCPKFGYHPEPDKSYLIVHPDFVAEAEEMFKPLGIKIVTGRRFISGNIGPKGRCGSMFKEKIESWVGSVIKNLKYCKNKTSSSFHRICQLSASRMGLYTTSYG